MPMSAARDLAADLSDAGIVFVSKFGKPVGQVEDEILEDGEALKDGVRR